MGRQENEAGFFPICTIKRVFLLMETVLLASDRGFYLSILMAWCGALDIARDIKNDSCDQVMIDSFFFMIMLE